MVSPFSTYNIIQYIILKTFHFKVQKYKENLEEPCCTVFNWSTQV